MADREGTPSCWPEGALVPQWLVRDTKHGVTHDVWGHVEGTSLPASWHFGTRGPGRLPGHSGHQQGRTRREPQGLWAPGAAPSQRKACFGVSKGN